MKQFLLDVLAGIVSALVAAWVLSGLK